jgi:hypothetical protein
MRLFCVCISFFAVFFFASGQSLNETRAYAFFQMERGNFEIALEELSRVLFFQGGSPEFRIVYQIGLCYAAIGDQILAEWFFKQAYFLANNPEDRCEASLSLVQNHLLAGRYRQAIEDLLTTDWTASAEWEKRANFYLGVCFFYLEEDDQAYQAFLKTDLDPLNIHLHLKERDNHLRPGEVIPTILSILLPGAGQAYLGAYPTAFNSLAVNSLFIAITLNSYSSLGFFQGLLVIAPWFQRYYLGGVLNTRHLAREKRARNREEVLYRIVTGL